MLDRRSHQPGHPRRRGPEAGGRGLVQVHHPERAWRDDARLQHLRHRFAESRHSWTLHQQIEQFFMA